ncbi:ABC transporter ATP-binding protein [Deinococcus metallilatus]|uniref:ABC transporter ATP-binding protein n=1 Tax=Deinococcus metallilatus TaxID=1211322 RepID=A0AAJ5K010_9DEIO|nr:ABC transporter ATP-binding protein [Deinococcus metallilatus]MBB5295523.1 ABC-type Fe3+/spermidine/putrescine transport system ATPase subunit [Deinococcus metallilatus]QBY07963.1 ABC transporter ATP-binding protein [Deinococcus metallilatus]RXJ12856.1 ABC transporter ATP-binding protein [Deinococcus metallilatus]TLK27222.1 ABC transporter ATP-binding protein [Deinococcus metallilatus]GMA16201.1 ABC transporter ATP-binding protein [Deinococcus metallilatus]
MIPAALALHHLSKHFGPTVAVDDVSLNVGAGETVALLGPSGCGKSTVLRCVAGLERPDAGRICIGGRDVTTLPPEARHVGLVFQDYALFPHLSVLGNVVYGPRMRGAGRAEAQRRAREALALVGLEPLAGRRTTELSGGQAQRVALARAVATGAPLLLLDEPLSNLDEQLRARLRGDLRELFARLRAGVLLVTHDQREALAVASRVAVMRAGRLVQVGAAQEVFARPATAWVAAFLGHANVLPGPDGLARLIPEDAVRLGVGDAFAVTARQTTDTGTEVTVAHPLGPLTLHLSAREAEDIHAQTLRLTVDPARVLTLPDDRERP